MKSGYSRFIKLIHAGGDFILLNFSFLVSYVFINELNPLIEFNDHYIFLHIGFNLVWALLILIFDLYDFERVTRLVIFIWKLFQTILLHGLIILSFISAIKGNFYSRGHLFCTYLLFTFLSITWSILFIRFLKNYRRSGSNYRRIIIVGAGSAGNQIYSYLESDLSPGYQFLGFFDDFPDKCVHKELVLGEVKDVRDFVARERVDEIYCALPLTSIKKIRELMSLADNNLIRFKIVPDFRSFLNKKVDITFYNRVPVLSLRSEPLENILNRIVKRAFDIVFSIFVIIFVCIPTYPIFAILIKISSKGPILFKQKRNGRNNEEFYCYKYRSMAVNEDADRLQATSGDQRITKIGSFLRKTNLDELPQFFNVLIGNMSVVGPRPHMLKHTLEYSIMIDKFMVRHLVKPGITGWAQVHGFRGVTTNSRMMLKRVRYDAWYIENWSFLLDIQIILMTVYNMIRGEKNAV